MAKDKKTDYSKLSLGTKRKPVKKVMTSEAVDAVVEKIHQPEPVVQPVQVQTPREEKVRTKRVTLDIPIPLHAEIRKKTFDMGITMKKYFLDLAQEHLAGEE